MAFRVYVIAGLVTLCIVAGLLVPLLLDDGSDVMPDIDAGSGVVDDSEQRDEAAPKRSGSDGVRHGPRHGKPGGGKSEGGTGGVGSVSRTERKPSGPGTLDKPPVEQDLPEGSAEIVALVRDDTGEAIVGMDVLLRSTSGVTANRGSRTVETTSAGEALFARIRAGSFSLRVKRQGKSDLAAAYDVSVAEGQREVIEIRVGDFDLSIAGRIIDTSGQPISGITVAASAYAVGAAAPTLVPVGQGVLRATTTEDGRFEVTGLDEGEYEVRTSETERFASVHRVVHAGLQSVDFVLEEGVLVRIVGMVVHAATEEPLFGVRVVPLGFGSRQATTGRDGRFETSVPLRSTQTVYSVELRLDGFATDRRTLRINELRELEEWQIEAALEELESTTALTGILVGDDGEALRGETVHVHSASRRVRMQGISDRDGRFEVRGLQASDDYRVWVYPSGPYRDLIRDSLRVPEAGLDLALTFESLGRGSVTGRVVDIEGTPVPHFGLWVNSTAALNKSRRVSTGARGEFLVEGVPAGELIFQTRSLPRFTVRGMKLEDGEEAETEIVLDWGEAEIASHIVDEAGEPIALARVDLHWQKEWGTGRTTSYRSTQTDHDGRFRFTQLGPGLHRLRITARGYKSDRIEVENGSSPETIVLQK